MMGLVAHACVCVVGVCVGGVVWLTSVSAFVHQQRGEICRSSLHPVQQLMFSFTLCHHNTSKLVSVSASCPDLNRMIGDLAPPVVNIQMLTNWTYCVCVILYCLVLKFRFFVLPFLFWAAVLADYRLNMLQPDASQLSGPFTSIGQQCWVVLNLSERRRSGLVVAWQTASRSS